MIFRKQGKLIEINRTQFKTDKSYYNEIYKLQQENNVMTSSSGATSNVSTRKSASSTLQLISNLLLK